MTMDGFFFNCLTRELRSTFCGSRIEDIYYDQLNNLILQYRAPGQTLKMMVAVTSPPYTIQQAPQTTGAKERNGFSQVLRNSLGGLFLRTLTSPAFERWATLEFAPSPHQELITHKLHVELMGRQNDLTLTETDTIIISTRGHTVTTRPLLQGHQFTPPPPAGKINPLNLTPELLGSLIAQRPEELIERTLVRLVFGVSPLLAREICCLAGISSHTLAGDINSESVCLLCRHVSRLGQQSLEAAPEGHLFLRDERPQAFYWLDLKHLADCQHEEYPSLSAVLTSFFRQSHTDAAQTLARQLSKIIQNRHLSVQAKLKKQHTELKRAQDCQQYRELGSTVLANLNSIPRGTTNIDLVNPHSGDQVKVSLNPALSPAENAQVYFKKYRKFKNAAIIVNTQIKKSEEMLNYLESLNYNLESATKLNEVEEIQAEMQDQGLVKIRKKLRNRDKSRSMPLVYYAPSGERILVGRNNRQNEQLSLSADKEHLWLHVRDYPGSHVVLESTNPDTDALVWAASAAAWHSKANSSPKVEVVYTQVKNVKKIPGTKPGMVKYDKFYSVIVDPRRYLELASEEKPKIPGVVPQSP